MYTTRLQHLLLIFLLLSLPGWGQASQESTIQPVSFATSIIKPWGMEIDGEQKGLLIDTTRALFLETGIPYQNKLRPYTRVFHELISGYSEFALVFQSPKIDQQALYIGKVAQTRVIIVGLASMKKTLPLEQMAGFKIGHMRGSKYGPRFDEATHVTRHPVNSIAQGLAMLLRGRIDAMAAVDHTIYWGMSELDISAEDIMELTSIPGPTLALYMSKNTKQSHLLPIYQQAIEKLTADKVFESIYGNPQRWLNTGE